MKRVWCIILGLIPVVNFGLQYYFSGKENTRSIFQHHRTCYRLDRIFVPINIIFCFLLTSISRKIILLLGMSSLIINYMMHHLRSLDKNIKNSHLVNPQVTKAGWIHMLFSSIEMLIIVLILLSSSQDIYMYIALGLLGIFTGGLVYGAYRIHHKLYRSDVMAVILLGGAVILKIIIMT